jgi:xylitol oxidase
VSLRNWAGNLEFRASKIYRPETVEEIQEIVAASDRIRPAGTRHSFNDIADTGAATLSTERLNRVLELGNDNVLVEAGIRYGDLAAYLAQQGMILANFASLPHISVAGSVATGTHGSGVSNPSLSAAVREVKVVKADGSLSTLKRGQDREFDGAVVALGALGVVTSLMLDVVPMFEVAQTVYEGLPWKSLASELDAVLSDAYSVSLFTYWSSDLIDQVWVKRKEGESTENYFGAKAADGPRHPLPDMPRENCTQQMGIYGPAHERLPHFRMEFTPSGGEELQAEYILPREHAFSALMEIDAMRDRIAPLLYVSEIRTVAADDLWLSSSSGRDSVCIHFTWKQRQAEVEALLPEIEARLAQFGARPHWGKLFDMKADRVQPLYPRFGDFEALARTYDPTGKFRNEFLDSRLFGR